MEKNNEIDLFTVLKTTWKGRRTIVYSVIVFAILGIFIAFLTPRTYIASTIMVPQMQSRSSGFSGLGDLGGLAAMAGINLSGMTQTAEDLSPLVYPEIVNSYAFMHEIMYSLYSWSGVDHAVSLVEYVQSYGKPGFFARMKKNVMEIPGQISAWISPQPDNVPPATTQRGGGPTYITNSEKELWDDLTKTMLLSVDKKNGFVTLTVNGPEPTATAQIADKAQKLLQSKITEYRIEKARQNRDFIQERFNEKKKEFEDVQARLARFRDQNRGTLSNVTKTELDQLQSEHQLALTVYSELAKQLETAKISVKEDTPIFSIIQSVIVPVKPTKPRKLVILVLSILMGGFLGLAWVFAKKHWSEVE